MAAFFPTAEQGLNGPVPVLLQGEHEASIHPLFAVSGDTGERVNVVLPPAEDQSSKFRNYVFSTSGKVV